MTNPEDPGKQTRIVPVRDRQIVVRQLQDAQLLLLAREARLAQKPDLDSGRKMIAVARIFDILESAVVQDEDREYLMDLTVAGDLTLSDMTSFVSAFEDEDAAARPKVRRGRTPTKR